MMKRLLPLTGLFLYVCLAFASIVDDPETIDGYLTNGEYGGAGIELEEFEKLVVDGGGAARITAQDNSVLQIISTSLPLELDVGGVYDIHLTDNSSLLFTGGATESIVLYKNSFSELKGGQINYVTIYRRPQDYCYVTIFCQEGYLKTTTGISGLWADGTDFDIQFCNVGSPFPATHNFVNVEIVPEPTTLLLLGLGSLLFRRKR